MKKTILVIISAAFIFSNAYSQITKGNWLVGGTGSFASQLEKLNAVDVNGLKITLSPDIGYFLVDKFAVGAMPSFAYNKNKYNGGTSFTQQISIGPFLRYYFLRPEKTINIFVESAYQYSVISGSSGSSQYQNSFIFSAGPVVYFNSSVGLELTANYEIYNNPRAIASAKTFSLGIGFQIHLRKEK